MNNLKGIFRGELIEQFGVLTPGYDSGFVDSYMTEQFKSRAQEYVKTHYNSDHCDGIIGQALRVLGVGAPPTTGDFTILDVGSGAGGSVFTLIKMFGHLPNVRIICSDLSMEMLALLRQGMVDLQFNCKIDVLQLNAEQLDFHDASVDLVVGYAIAHHLYRPDEMFRHVARVLKPGGNAIFMEPFENGNVILSAAMGIILADDRKQQIAENVQEFLRNIIADRKSRIGRDKTAECFKNLDDKWMFTRNYLLESFPSAQGSLQIRSLHSPTKLFENQMAMLLSLGLSLDSSALPIWAWNIIRNIDDSMSDDCKEDVLIEGMVLFTKF
ncbi:MULTISPECIES: class I SAM-dependent methyltransferase [unclassified Pseudomonas]|uniref:class I SAM-dependent methyltransferase n=1 Tax=unclassified Pseudomonas TaxID=196821 RepID=UPI00249A7CD7|nr:MULTISPECIES: class I SAM-dependent methyltransferase [unclassified Pseudomonas]